MSKQSMPFDDGSFVDYFMRSILLGCVTLCFAMLTTLYSMIMIGSCMCFEACIDDLIASLDNLGNIWSNGIYFERDLAEVIEYQIDCTM